MANKPHAVEVEERFNAVVKHEEQLQLMERADDGDIMAAPAEIRLRSPGYGS